jgi:catechol 2,3-dioxygenase-like lactoylglutathione lyase family enzyme
MHLQGLDHVALSVRDVERSLEWYVEVLGLERQYEEMWNGIPKFVGKGRTGIALFPTRDNGKGDRSRGQTRMLHFALRADRENFARAERELRERGIAFRFEDHGIALSIYFRDPDGHEVEVTTYELE